MQRLTQSGQLKADVFLSSQRLVKEKTHSHTARGGETADMALL